MHTKQKSYIYIMYPLPNGDGDDLTDTCSSRVTSNAEGPFSDWGAAVIARGASGVTLSDVKLLCSDIICDWDWSSLTGKGLNGN